MKKFSRRDFLKLTGASLGSMAFQRFEGIYPSGRFEFPQGDKLGRVSVTPYFYATEMKAAPDFSAATVAALPEDTVVVWMREVVGTAHYSQSKRWIETPEGFIYYPHLQPVYNHINIPMATLPEGKAGFWAEVTVPYVDLRPLSSSVSSPSFSYIMSLGQSPRLYYSQVVWIDGIKEEGGKTFYRFNEDLGHGYGYGDIFWADATAFRMITEAEDAPISPDIDPALKKIVADVTYQTISCYEGEREVFFCRMSSGAGDFNTPVGSLYTWWKTFSIHMSANTASDSGYDTAGVSWPTFISGAGVAIHSVFWHSDYGVRRSHGCINVEPDAAKWIFCWTSPHVSLDQSEIKMTWPDVGTEVSVVERSF